MKFNQRLRVRPGFPDGVEFKLSEYTGAVERPNGMMFIADRSSPVYQCARVIRHREIAGRGRVEIINGISALISHLEADMRATITRNNMSARLKEAITVHMVDVDMRNMTARILAPPHAENLGDDDWLLLMEAGTEMSHELRGLGFTVENGEDRFGPSPLREVYGSWREREDVKKRIAGVF